MQIVSVLGKLELLENADVPSSGTGVRSLFLSLSLLLLWTLLGSVMEPLHTASIASQHPVRVPMRKLTPACDEVRIIMFTVAHICVSLHVISHFVYACAHI